VVGRIGVGKLLSKEDQALIWDYFKPRHTITWNMLVLSWRELETYTQTFVPFEIEYLWQNFIIRLWLYRITVKTLEKLPAVQSDARLAVKAFDDSFQENGQNTLKALRDMIEHFDDFAAGKGRGPLDRGRDLDPWRTVTNDRFERGNFSLERSSTYEAAIQMRADAKAVSDKFIHWYKN
jgi:hypothetical protein